MANHAGKGTTKKQEKAQAFQRDWNQLRKAARKGQVRSSARGALGRG